MAPKTPKQMIADYMRPIVGGVAELMVERHVRKYLEEKGKEELTLSDIPDFGEWFAEHLTHISIIAPDKVKKIPEDFKNLRI
jgi:hypothetical protein